MSPSTRPQLPEWQLSQWINAAEPQSLAALRGKVVLLHAFQMLCPGCVAHGLPQAERVHQWFADQDLQVIGLHTVFEHHQAMGPTALRAFVHEYRWSFPIAIDQPAADSDVPLTMRAWGLRGTPSLIVLDRSGAVRLHHFGRLDDLALGALLGRLLGEPGIAQSAKPPATDQTATTAEACDEQGCALSAQHRNQETQ